MHEGRRRVAAEESGELDLTSGRGHEVQTPDHVRDLLEHVVDSGGELIRPVAVTIPGQEVAALQRRDLKLRSLQEVFEPLL